MEKLTLIVFTFLIVICFLMVIVILHYMENKTRKLKQIGYEFVFYYMKNCGSLDYYREYNKHISPKYDNEYRYLEKNMSRWYVFKMQRRGISELLRFYQFANSFTKDVSRFFSINHYFAYSECARFEKRYSIVEKILEKVADDEFKKYIKVKYNQDVSTKMKYNVFTHSLIGLRKKHNIEFVKTQLEENKEYFDSVLDYPLDAQQRFSVVTLEDNCLVISSAGSGKTSTSIAKVKYLLEKRKIQKEKILVLSYNRKTADEFGERLGVEGLTCKTFHALALSIIGEVEDKRPTICDDTFLLQCYYNLVQTNEEFKKAVNEFFSEISDLTKFDHDYEKAEDYYKDRETYGIVAPYTDMNGSPIYTRSVEEKKICTWLSSHGIDFLYEQPYPIETADKNHRNYKPDFTIYYKVGGRVYYVFLEHFGIDKDGNVPIWFGDGKRGGFEQANREYNADIYWKRELHKKNKTCLLETTSAMFHDGTVFEKLENQLKGIGLQVRELSEEEKYERLFKRNKAMEDNVMTLLASFINLMKSNGKSFDGIMQTIKQSKQSEEFCERSRFLMYEIIKPLYDEYQKSLKERGMMDFTDLILHAADLCNSGKYKSPYSYILVDEFQDISIDRFKLIQALRNEFPLTKTYCVGDDWQSIYRFSGSDMNLFNSFENYFGFTVKCRIETTYRFGNPLVGRSSEFILKNPAQVKKEVHPYSDKIKTGISFVPFLRDKEDGYLLTIKGILDHIPAEESVLLIARYNYEVNVFPKSCVTQSPNSKRAVVNYNGRTMQFMSVHAAKGLEADNVLILNCSQDRGGFPSRVSDDPILGFVLSEIDNFEYSEERRLFYVAITRAKKHTFVLYNEHMPSVFVTEMMEVEEEKDNNLICPMCKKGKLRIAKEDLAKNGNEYRFYCCSNSVAGCGYNWLVFYKSKAEIVQQYKIETEMIKNAQADYKFQLRKKKLEEEFDNLMRSELPTEL